MLRWLRRRASAVSKPRNRTGRRWFRDGRRDALLNRRPQPLKRGRGVAPLVEEVALATVSKPRNAVLARLLENIVSVDYLE